MDNSHTKVSALISLVPSEATVIQWVDLEASYEGAGAIIYKLADGSFGGLEYSHCSCFGPTDNAHELPTEATYELIRRHISEYVLEKMPALDLSLGEIAP